MSQQFREIVATLERGQLEEDVDEALSKLVDSVRRTGKAGKLTLVLSIAPASKGDTNVLTVSTEIKSAEPKPDRGTSIYYSTDDNRLVRDDPRQMSLPLKSVPNNVTQLKEVGS